MVLLWILKFLFIYLWSLCPVWSLNSWSTCSTDWASWVPLLCWIFNSPPSALFFLLCIFYCLWKNLKVFVSLLFTCLLFLIVLAWNILWCSQPLNMARSIEWLSTWTPPAVSASLSWRQFWAAKSAHPSPIQWGELPLWEPSAHCPEAFPRYVGWHSFFF